MADRIYKGHLHTTNSIHEENQKAFTEASEEFNEPHKGGLTPFEVLRDVLMSGDFTCTGDTDGTEMWLHADDVFIHIESNGTVEIGISGG